MPGRVRAPKKPSQGASSGRGKPTGSSGDGGGGGKPSKFVQQAAQAIASAAQGAAKGGGKGGGKGKTFGAVVSSRPQASTAAAVAAVKGPSGRGHGGVLKRQENRQRRRSQALRQQARSTRRTVRKLAEAREDVAKADSKREYKEARERERTWKPRVEERQKRAQADIGRDASRRLKGAAGDLVGDVIATGKDVAKAAEKIGKAIEAEKRAQRHQANRPVRRAKAKAEKRDLHGRSAGRVIQAAEEKKREKRADEDLARMRRQNRKELEEGSDLDYLLGGELVELTNQVKKKRERKLDRPLFKREEEHIERKGMRAVKEHEEMLDSSMKFIGAVPEQGRKYLRMLHKTAKHGTRAQKVYARKLIKDGSTVKLARQGKRVFAQTGKTITAKAWDKAMKEAEAEQRKKLAEIVPGGEGDVETSLPGRAWGDIKDAANIPASAQALWKIGKSAAEGDWEPAQQAALEYKESSPMWVNLKLAGQSMSANQLGVPGISDPNPYMPRERERDLRKIKDRLSAHPITALEYATVGGLAARSARLSSIASKIAVKAPEASAREIRKAARAVDTARPNAREAGAVKPEKGRLRERRSEARESAIDRAVHNIRAERATNAVNARTKIGDKRVASANTRTPEAPEGELVQHYGRTMPVRVAQRAQEAWRAGRGRDPFMQTGRQLNRTKKKQARSVVRRMRAAGFTESGIVGHEASALANAGVLDDGRDLLQALSNEGVRATFGRTNPRAMRRAAAELRADGTIREGSEVDDLNKARDFFEDWGNEGAVDVIDDLLDNPSYIFEQRTRDLADYVVRESRRIDEELGKAGYFGRSAKSMGRAEFRRQIQGPLTRGEIIHREKGEALPGEEARIGAETREALYDDVVEFQSGKRLQRVQREGMEMKGAYAPGPLDERGQPTTVGQPRRTARGERDRVIAPQARPQKEKTVEYSRGEVRERSVGEIKGEIADTEARLAARPDVVEDRRSVGKLVEQRRQRQQKMINELRAAREKWGLPDDRTVPGAYDRRSASQERWNELPDEAKNEIRALEERILRDADSDDSKTLAAAEGALHHLKKKDRDKLEAKLVRLNYELDAKRREFRDLEGAVRAVEDLPDEKLQAAAAAELIARANELQNSIAGLPEEQAQFLRAAAGRLRERKAAIEAERPRVSQRDGLVWVDWQGRGDPYFQTDGANPEIGYINPAAGRHRGGDQQELANAEAVRWRKGDEIAQRALGEQTIRNSLQQRQQLATFMRMKNMLVGLGYKGGERMTLDESARKTRARLENETGVEWTFVAAKPGGELESLGTPEAFLKEVAREPKEGEEVHLVPQSVHDIFGKETQRPGALSTTGQLLSRAYVSAVLPFSVGWHMGNQIDLFTRLVVAGGNPFSNHNLGRELKRQLAVHFGEQRAREIYEHIQGHLGSRRDSSRGVQVRDIGLNSNSRLLRGLTEPVSAISDKLRLRASMWPKEKAFDFAAWSESPYTTAAMGRSARLLARDLGVELKGHRDLAEQLVREFAKRPELAEDFGRRTLEIVGDYSNSATGRAVISNIDPFYRWMVEANKLIFWTLPTKHPIKTALGLQAAWLGAEEAKRLGLDQFGDAAKDFLGLMFSGKGLSSGAIPIDGGFRPTAPYTSWGEASKLLEDPVDYLSGRVFPYLQKPALRMAGYTQMSKPLEWEGKEADGIKDLVNPAWWVGNLRSDLTDPDRPDRYKGVPAWERALDALVPTYVPGGPQIQALRFEGGVQNNQGSLWDPHTMIGTKVGLHDNPALNPFPKIADIKAAFEAGGRKMDREEPGDEGIEAWLTDLIGAFKQGERRTPEREVIWDPTKRKYWLTGEDRPATDAEIRASGLKGKDSEQAEKVRRGHPRGKQDSPQKRLAAAREQLTKARKDGSAAEIRKAKQALERSRLAVSRETEKGKGKQKGASSAEITKLAKQFGARGPAAEELVRLSIKYGRRYGVPASVLFAQQGIESGWGANLGPSSAGAQGYTQFMPETRAAYMEQYDVDPWKDVESAVKAQAIYLGEANDFGADPRAAIFSYNHADWYVDEVLDAAGEYAALDKAQGKVGKIKGVGIPNKKGLSVNELFYDPGINIVDGAESSAIGDHGDHVHFGSEDPRSIMRVAHKAMDLGLRVSENEVFEGSPVERVHKTNSMHYGVFDEGSLPKRIAKKTKGAPLGKALDIAGDAAAMAELNKWVADRSGATITGTASAPTSSYTGSVTPSSGVAAPSGPGTTPGAQSGALSVSQAVSLAEDGRRRRRRRRRRRGSNAALASQRLDLALAFLRDEVDPVEFALGTQELDAQAAAAPAPAPSTEFGLANDESGGSGLAAPDGT